MTAQTHYTVPTEWLELIQDQGWEAVPELLRIVINADMRTEREQFLGAGPYQRSPERAGHANGFKPKTVQTRLGELTFAVPQVREGGFYPQAPEKGLGIEAALTLALAEMCVQGISTRKVAAIVEKLCGSQVSSAQVSRAAAQLDGALEAWRTRALGECPYLLLDAR